MHLCQYCISPGLFGQPCCRVTVGMATGAMLGLETFSLLRFYYLPRLQYPSILVPIFSHTKSEHSSREVSSIDNTTQEKV